MADGLLYSRQELEALGYRQVAGRWRFGAALDSPVVITTPPNKYGLAPNGRPYKSKWEAAYAREELAPALTSGAITWWSYEAIRLRLADGAYFTPDFPVRLPNGQLVMREVKGFWREAARLRVKLAANQFPWLRIEIITKQQGRWHLLECFNA